MYLVSKLFFSSQYKYKQISNTYLDLCLGFVNNLKESIAIGTTFFKIYILSWPSISLSVHKCVFVQNDLYYSPFCILYDTTVNL